MAFTRATYSMIAILLTTGLFVAPGFSSSSHKYKNVVVTSFETPADFPADFKGTLRGNIVQQLLRTGRFENVTILDEGQASPDNADLLLTGKITRFKKGSRFARWMVPGLGATSIKAQIEVVDPATKKTLIEKQVSGKVLIGAFGGNSKGATNGLAKDIAKALKKL